MRIQHTLAAFTLCSLLAVGSPVAALAQSAPSELNVSGYSVEQLEQLIAKLTKQLAEMKKGSPCYVSDKELSLGDGEDDGLTEEVRRLQNFLVEKGHLNYKATGYFGKMTRTALSNFQKQQGIAMTTVFDAATREKAHSMSCKKAVKAAMNVEKQKMEDKAKMEKAEKERLAKEAAKQSGQVKSISVKASGNKVYWSVDGYSSQGFKVVWSKTPGPQYPNRYPQDSYQYFDKATQSETSLKAFDGAGTYYVRVCEYLGGSCGVFSNEVTVNLE